jgi:hypothetical protein
MGSRSQVSGWRVLAMLALALLAIYVAFEIYLRWPRPRRDVPVDVVVRPLDDAFTRLRRADSERVRARVDALRALRHACAGSRESARDLIGLLAELRKHFPSASREARECLRLQFGQCVRMLGDAREEEALSRIFHLGSFDGIEPDYEFVWIHLQSDRREEAAAVAAEAVAAREKAGVPDLAVHLQLYAWLLRNAGLSDEARAVAERASRLAEDPPPAREPEREEQATDDARPR